MLDRAKLVAKSTNTKIWLGNIIIHLYIFLIQVIKNEDY